MSDFKQTWGEVADRLEALGLKLKLHRKQTGASDVPEALSKLGHGVQELSPPPSARWATI